MSYRIFGYSPIIDHPVKEALNGGQVIVATLYTQTGLPAIRQIALYPGRLYFVNQSKLATAQYGLDSIMSEPGVVRSIALIKQRLLKLGQVKGQRSSSMFFERIHQPCGGLLDFLLKLCRFLLACRLVGEQREGSLYTVSVDKSGIVFLRLPNNGLAARLAPPRRDARNPWLQPMAPPGPLRVQLLLTAKGADLRYVTIMTLILTTGGADPKGRGNRGQSPICHNHDTHVNHAGLPGRGSRDHRRHLERGDPPRR